MAHWGRHDDDAKVTRCGCGWWKYEGQPCRTCDAMRRAGR